MKIIKNRHLRETVLGALVVSCALLAGTDTMKCIVSDVSIGHSNFYDRERIREMKFQVLSYDAANFYHVCRDENGKKHFFDLMVASKLPEHVRPEDIIGETIDAVDGSIAPYISIVNDFVLIPAGTEGEKK